MKKIILIFLGIFFISCPALADKNTESAYDRIMRTHTMRCAYIPYEPFISKNPNTGKLSGITVDYINKITERLGIKTDWVSEVNIDQVIPALDGKKFDAICVPCTPIEDFEKVVSFKGKMGALPYFVYVPAKSEITESQLKTAKFATQDGFAMTGITKENFSEAKTYSLPQTASVAEMYDQLKYRKADAMVNESISAANYIKNNPNVIRRFSEKPVVAKQMFLLSEKTDIKMGDFLDKNFSVSVPENLALMKEISTRYNLQEGSIIFGE